MASMQNKPDPKAGPNKGKPDAKPAAKPGQPAPKGPSAPKR
jgi:hypothetical protein